MREWWNGRHPSVSIYLLCNTAILFRI